MNLTGSGMVQDVGRDDAEHDRDGPVLAAMAAMAAVARRCSAVDGIRQGAFESMFVANFGLYASWMSNILKPLIYLASASPRRSMLLHQIGIAHRIRPAPVDERAQEGESPPGYVQRLADTKARSLWAHLQSRPEQLRLPVLAADTAVVVDGHVLGKPQDEADALRMLRLLSGRTHEVYTAVSLLHEGGLDGALSISEVTFRPISPDEMRAYWRCGEPLDKAGAYAIQGRAAIYIERITGSHSAIMGLPLFETGRLLQAAGLRFADSWKAGGGDAAEQPAPTVKSRSSIMTEVRG